MPFLVRLSDGAARDLEWLCAYLNQHVGHRDAIRLLERMEVAFESLAEFPRRGRYPAELADLGIREYREVSVKPYRLIYRVDVDSVDVPVVADGRREMQALLQRRLLQA